MIESLIQGYLQRHEAYLLTLLDSTPIPAPQIKNAMHYSLFPGGKRLRPMLIYLTGLLLDYDSKALDAMAAAMELVHGYSLIHDDLPAMDNDDLRRGKPSCHRAFDEATAILTGDGMQALAIDLLLETLPTYLPSARVIAVTQSLVKACGPAGMVSGQSLDLTELGQKTITEAQLANIHQLKTGQLINACINMVLATDDYDPALSLALQTFARHLGLVFQMQDDYLDRYQTDNHKAHGRSSDLANQKITYANLFTQHELEQAINTVYQQAQASLAPFGPRSQALQHYLHGIIRPECLTAQV